MRFRRFGGFVEAVGLDGSDGPCSRIQLGFKPDALTGDEPVGLDGQRWRGAARCDREIASLAGEQTRERFVGADPVHGGGVAGAGAASRCPGLLS